MNVLEYYQPTQVHISEPIEVEDDHYFCKLSYNQAPFIVKTNKVCYYKKKRTSNYLYISLTSKEYLEWFERFYHDVIEQFHGLSADWFEEPLSKSDMECSFINPLKTNIKDNCFDIMCNIDENRLMVTDTNDNMNTIDQLKESDVIPTFHIKGIKFNSKHFALDIELHHLYILLNPVPVPEVLEIKVPEIKEPEAKEPETKVVETTEPDSDELSEYVMETSNLTYAEVELDNLSIYKVYEFLNTRIKERLIEDIRGIFTSKKIKTKIDFSEVIDDEEPDE